MVIMVSVCINCNPFGQDLAGRTLGKKEKSWTTAGKIGGIYPVTREEERYMALASCS